MPKELTKSGYQLSKDFFDWSFENPDKVKPIHSALYFFIIDKCNRLGWKQKFGLPSEHAMEALGVKNWKTYIKALNDLHEFGFIEFIERSKNQYTSNIIALVNFGEATGKALSKATSKQVQSTVSIDKPNNYKTENVETEESPSQDKDIHKQQRPEHAKDKYAAGYNKDDLRPYAYMKQQKRLRYEQFYNEFGKHISNPNDFLQSFNDKYDYEGKTYDADTIYYRLRSFARNWQKKENK